MELQECINQRYSVRDFQNKPVEKEKLLKVMHAVNMAPSAVNFQPHLYIIVTRPTLLQQLCDCYKREWLRTAPAIIVACGDHSCSWKRRNDQKDHCDIDMGIAIEHLCLAATDLGLGTCWVCNFDAPQCKEIMGLPTHLEPVALIPIGYPTNDQIPPKNRKTLEAIIQWESYQ